MALTGMETWAIIAPVLAAEMVTKHDIATDAYITTFPSLSQNGIVTSTARGIVTRTRGERGGYGAVSVLLRVSARLS